MNSQSDEQFSGFISGLQTTILLNSKRIHFKIQIPSKQAIYESTIEYNIQDPVFIEVKKAFKNLPLLFEYINEYSEDAERIKIDLKDLRIKIVKNQGPRRMKNSPVLYIPLKKIFIYEKKQPTKLQKDIEAALKFNEVLQFKYEHEKGQRKSLINEFNQLKDEIYELIRSSDIETGHILHQVEQIKKHKKQHNEIRREKKRLLVDQDLEKILLNSVPNEKDYQQSLFFEDESLSGLMPRSESLKKDLKSSESKAVEPLMTQHKEFIYDPFSYL